VQENEIVYRCAHTGEKPELCRVRKRKPKVAERPRRDFPKLAMMSVLAVYLGCGIWGTSEPQYFCWDLSATGIPPHTKNPFLSI